MSQENREKLRILKGTPVYMYSTEDFTLLHIFGSKQQAYTLINIHHTTLNDCLNSGILYLDNFFFSLDCLWKLKIKKIHIDSCIITDLTDMHFKNRELLL